MFVKADKNLSSPAINLGNFWCKKVCLDKSEDMDYLEEMYDPLSLLWMTTLADVFDQSIDC